MIKVSRNTLTQGCQNVPATGDYESEAADIVWQATIQNSQLKFIGTQE